jgi:SAM-dependent methyltransferase
VHPKVFAEFDRICRARSAGGAVLEVGAIPSEESLLRLPALAHATEKIGVSLDGPARFADFEILAANANDLSRFGDGRFDTVLCNSVLEHDPRFWRTLAEIRRVARAGALVAIGVPGYAVTRRSRALKLLRPLRRFPGLGRVLRPWIDGRLASTRTLVVHAFPGDYYRFGEEAVREVLLEGLVDTEVRTVLDPPRFIGFGTRAAPAAP